MIFKRHLSQGCYRFINDHAKIRAKYHQRLSQVASTVFGPYYAKFRQQTKIDVKRDSKIRFECMTVR